MNNGDNQENQDEDGSVVEHWKHTDERMKDQRWT